jgi:hypothetical protein
MALWYRLADRYPARVLRGKPVTSSAWVKPRAMSRDRILIVRGRADIDSGHHPIPATGGGGHLRGTPRKVIWLIRIDGVVVV